MQICCFRIFISEIVFKLLGSYLIRFLKRDDQTVRRFAEKCWYLCSPWFCFEKTLKNLSESSSWHFPVLFRLLNNHQSIARISVLSLETFFWSLKSSTIRSTLQFTDWREKIGLCLNIHGLLRFIIDSYLPETMNKFNVAESLSFFILGQLRIQIY